MLILTYLKPIRDDHGLDPATWIAQHVVRLDAENQDVIKEVLSRKAYFDITYPGWNYPIQTSSARFPGIGACLPVRHGRILSLDVSGTS